ncbi:MAG: efflux RND transporter periplasmic adaptor subunit, partial [Planctomycetota bacterium]
IATDIKKIQVEASVPEADIGKIKINIPVTFTVDAYPELEFPGTVTQVRLSPTSVQNVVTYTVIIKADNSEEKLFPGMTATIIFETTRRENILKIPNAALRFKPEASMLAEPVGKNITGSENQPTRPNHAPGGISQFKSPDRRTTEVFINTPEGLQKIFIKTGLTDGSFTEILEGNLSEGQEILTGIMEKEEKKMLTNPFNPSRQSRRGMPR